MVDEDMAVVFALRNDPRARGDLQARVDARPSDRTAAAKLQLRQREALLEIRRLFADATYFGADLSFAGRLVEISKSRYEALQKTSQHSGVRSPEVVAAELDCRARTNDRDRLEQSHKRTLESLASIMGAHRHFDFRVVPRALPQIDVAALDVAALQAVARSRRSGSAEAGAHADAEVRDAVDALRYAASDVARFEESVQPLVKELQAALEKAGPATAAGDQTILSTEEKLITAERSAAALQWAYQKSFLRLEEALGTDLSSLPVPAVPAK